MFNFRHSYFWEIRTQSELSTDPVANGKTMLSSCAYASTETIQSSLSSDHNEPLQFDVFLASRNAALEKEIGRGRFSEQ